MIEHWRDATIGDLCEVISGQSPKGCYYNEAGDGVPFYQGKKEFRSRYIGPPKKWTTHVTKEAVQGDVLMSVRAPVGPINFATEKMCIGRGLAAIRPGECLDRNFLFYGLLSKQNEITGSDGAVFNSINRNQIRGIQFAVPPLPEQERIVAILDEAFEAIDTAIANTEKNLGNARELFESYLQRFFCAVEREHLGLSFNPTRALGELINIQSGYAFRSGDYTDEGHFLVRIGNVQDSQLVLSKPKYVQLDAKTQRFALKEGDFLTSLTGNIGRVARVEQEHLPAALNQRVARLTVANQDALSQGFLYHYLTSHLFRLALCEGGHGAAQQNVSPKAIGAIPIPLPPLPEQERIVATLDEADETVQEYEVHLNRKLISLTELKQSILQKAFSGELTASAEPMLQAARL